MRQYYQIKSKYPEALLLFRVGDFYETFGEDAIKTSRILGIVLTRRSNGAAADTELAGFPHHALDNYLPKLVRAGQKVAICDQLEDPKMTKKIVKRGVTELVTPGVTTNDQVLQSKSNNFLAAVHFGKGEHGIAFCDISTGELFTGQGNIEYIDRCIQSFAPKEILYSKSKKSFYQDIFSDRYYSTQLEEWIFKDDYCFELLTEHFKTESLKGFGVANWSLAIVASGAAFHYLKETRHDKLAHIANLSRIESGTFMWMDRFTIRNLELFNSTGANGYSLLDVIDETKTPMGARLLKRWLAMPLLDVDSIKKRQDLVESLLKDKKASSALSEIMQEVNDVDRLTAKLSSGKIQPKELSNLKLTLKTILKIKSLKVDDVLAAFMSKIPSNLELTSLLSEYLSDEPPTLVTKGDVIRAGINEELDELRDLLNTGKDKLLEIRNREAEATGITSLKIAFNNVFGYYLEVRNTHKNLVPEAWTRKQTLVNAERYITEELKEYEQKVLGAEERIQSLEARLYIELLDKCQAFIADVQKTSQYIAQLDNYLGFALLARKNNYCKPLFKDEKGMHLEKARHPVIEKVLAAGNEYISNDVALNNEQQIIMLTGPNMSGKSALLRQTALISILAQMGSCVPASKAELSIIDKIFVRVGASDNISEGESTFMVEMNETASILNNLSDKSLVILDEIGRGTSTYDGISIAWAIAEFIHEHPSQALTLFATHYHELNEMENLFSRIHNWSISVKEVQGKIIFMRKLKQGGSEHSFGIHVAKMAGMPALVTAKAEVMLKELERSRHKEQHKQAGKKAADEMQLSFFKLDDPVLEEIRQEINVLDINTLTPVEALMKLNAIKSKLGN